MAEPVFHRLNMGACLNCGRRMTTAARLPGDNEAPEAGSIMVCLYCSHAMEWDGAKLTPLSDEAIREMAGDRELLDTIDFANTFQNWKGKT